MKDTYIARRQRLLEDKSENTAVVIFAGSAPMKSQDEAYPFSVDRNFFYLTGIERENMILVMRKNYLGEYSETLFIEPYDEVLAKWVGGRMRGAEATEISGVETVADVAEFPDRLNSMVEYSRGLGKLTFYLDLWRYHKDQADTPAHTLAATLQKKYPAVAIEDINGDMAAMRSVKDEKEIAFMRQAQEHTRIAIEEMMRYAKPGMNERELEGAFDFALMKQGVRDHAFSSIFAGGKRATTLHYGENNQFVNDGEMVLI